MTYHSDGPRNPSAIPIGIARINCASWTTIVGEPVPQVADCSDLVQGAILNSHANVAKTSIGQGRKVVVRFNGTVARKFVPDVALVRAYYVESHRYWYGCVQVADVVVNV